MLQKLWAIPNHTPLLMPSLFARDAHEAIGLFPRWLVLIVDFEPIKYPALLSSHE